MRIGIVILPQQRWREQAGLWRRAEEYGFDHAWTYDHLTWDPLADEPWGATVPSLVAAATVTTRIGLGPWVASPNYRHPVTFARDVWGLDDVSDGRALLAVGAGTPRRDGRVLGTGAAGGADLPPADRAARLEEFVDLLDAVLTRPETTREGRFFSAVQARTRTPVDAGGAGPRPPGERPPLVVAANGPRLMRLAARAGDGWATTGAGGDDDASWWGRLADLVARFEEVAATQTSGIGIGTGTALRPGFRRMLNLDSAPTYSLTSVEHFTEVVGRARELGFTDVLAHWPRPAGLYAGDEAVLEQAAALLPTLRS